jgi:protein disulfide isomerase
MRSLLLVFLLAAAFARASDVVDAHDDDFDKVLGQSSLVLMEFYAPWCGHCKKLAPEWEKAATELKGKALLAKMDATVEKSVPSKYDIKGYPTIKVFRDGKISGDYDGGRSAPDIVRWVKANSGPAVNDVTSRSALDAAKKENDLVIVSFASSPAEWFTAIANQLRSAAYFASVTDSSLFDGAAGSVVAYKNFDEPREVFEGDNAAQFESFVKTASVRLFDEIGPQNYKNYFDRALPMGWLFVTPGDAASDTAKAAVAAAAKNFKGKLSLFWVDASKYGQMAGRVGLKGDKFPAFAVDHEGEHYTFSEDFSEDAITSFLKSYLEGTLRPSVKTEDAPEPHTVNGVTTVVGSTFDALVNNADVDVLIEFYAPWCGHCKKLAPTWDKVGKALKDQPVRIAKIDATANDYPQKKYKVEGFPTIMFIPKTTREPKVFEGDRSFDAIINYIKREATSPITVDVKEDDV